MRGHLIFVGHYFKGFCYVQMYSQNVFISGIKYLYITWDQNNTIFNKKDRHLQGRRVGETLILKIIPKPVILQLK